MKLSRFAISYQDAGAARWTSVGIFVAITAAGAIRQFMRDAKLFPNLVAVKAEIQE